MKKIVNIPILKFHDLIEALSKDVISDVYYSDKETETVTLEVKESTIITATLDVVFIEYYGKRFVLSGLNYERIEIS